MFNSLNKYKKYKFTDKKKSKGGIISSLLFVVALAMIVACIYMAYKMAGNAGMGMGVLAMLSLVTSISGIAVGIRSFREENVFFGLSWMGTVGNTVLSLLLLCLVLIGF